MTQTLYLRGWRDGFHGREPAELCDAYLDGWHAGLGKGDPTLTPRLDSACDGPSETRESSSSQETSR